MASIIPVVEYCKARKLPTYLAAVDVNKAYDSVNRESLRSILAHTGLMTNRFIKLIFRAMTVGPIAVTGSTGLSDWFWASCGIK